MLLGIEPGASCIPHKYFTTELQSSFPNVFRTSKSIDLFFVFLLFFLCFVCLFCFCFLKFFLILLIYLFRRESLNSPPVFTSQAFGHRSGLPHPVRVFLNICVCVYSPRACVCWVIILAQPLKALPKVRLKSPQQICCP